MSSLVCARTLIDALSTAPPEKSFVTVWHDEDDIEEITFGEFIRASRAQAAQFREWGLGGGDRIVLILPQGIALMVAFAGAMMLGAVPAILAYPNFKVEPLKYAAGLAGVTQNLQARLVLVDREFPSEWLERIALADHARLMRATAGLPAPESLISFESHDPAGLAFIQHSAGTTGLQKGVALSHAVVLTQLEHLATALHIHDQDRIYSWLPLYHDMGLIACFMLPLVCHLPVVMQSPTEWVIHPDAMLQLISEYRCTLAWLPNFAYQLLARRVRPEDRLHYDLSSLRALVNCSEPVRAQSIDEFLAFYRDSKLRPDVVKTSYAMAENVFAITQSPADGAPRRIRVDGPALWNEHRAVTVVDGTAKSVCLVSSGRCIGGNQVRIVDSNGVELEEGRLGEILIQSDSLFGGYFNRPELTAQAFQDGWYRSGDLGFIHDAELYVIGRKKDLIIVAGKNIYPQDIEEIVCNHPDIHDGRAVAFGLYNSDLGTEDIFVVAEVEKEELLKNSREIERVLRAAIAAELDITARAIYLKPPKWVIKSTAGKPARSTTREKFLAEHPELRSEENQQEGVRS